MTTGFRNVVLIECNATDVSKIKCDFENILYHTCNFAWQAQTEIYGTGNETFLDLHNQRMSLFWNKLRTIFEVLFTIKNLALKANIIVAYFECKRDCIFD